MSRSWSGLTARRALGAFLVGALAVAGASPARAQGADDEESQLLVDEGKRALAKRNYKRAGELLDRALQVTPRRIDLYILRASVHGVLREHGAAVALLQRARALAPDHVGVNTALGIQLILVGKAAEGVPVLEKIVRTDPRRYDAQVVLGHEYLRQAQWAAAAAAFEKYFAHRPAALAGEDDIHRVDQAAARLRGGEPAKALELYEKVLDSDRSSERARLGVAWATAAISCKRAMPVFDAMPDLEGKYAEVSLVRGRCALMLGRVDEALARAERYRKAVPDSVQGWVLLGDVRSATRNWKDAETAFERAAEVDPADKLVSLKLGRTERLLGKHAQAVERLRAAGAPRGLEDDWTVEYGEALQAMGEGEALRDLLVPWLKTHETHATGNYLLGTAFRRLGDDPTAAAHFERGYQGGEPRAARALVETLNALAVGAVKRKDLTEARRRLEQADGIGGDILTSRNLGAVLISEGDLERAATVLKKALERDRDDAVALHLLARAHHGAKRWDDARAAYARAIRAYGKDPRVVAAHRDLANAELSAGHGEEAVAALDAAVAAAPAAARGELVAARYTAARAAATDAMRGGRFGVAVRVLRQVETAGDAEGQNDLRCDLALAATGSAQRELALEQLRRLEKAKARCPFVAPADELGVPILIAWNEGATLRRAKQALERLDGMRRKVTGVAEPLARQAAGDIAIRAATEAYAAGNLALARKYLTTARAYDKRSPELAHNLGVVALATGRLDEAIALLEPLVNEVPEARVNLGIAWERKGEPQRALEAWKSAASAGVRHPGLKGWIESKERFWGER